MLSLYVHIPFCRSRCPYCDFFLVTKSGLTGEFFRALSRETSLRAEELRGRTVGAIHFGGGTPSMVPAGYIEAWLGQVSGFCSFPEDIEIAFEANPEDLGGSAIEELRAIGVTRLSLGIQSFSAHKLLILGRKHTAREAVEVTGHAMAVFPSVNADLICGVPGEDSVMWDNDLDVALALHPHHLSVYMLSVEPKTLFQRDVSSGSLSVPGDEVQALMYEQALKKIGQGGYRHYEVSNFSLPGHHSRYNLASWMREEYLGFGPSAHSYRSSEGKETRFANVSGLRRYMAAPGKALEFLETLTERERFNEQVFLSLRINSGIDVEFLRKGNKLGQHLPDTVERFERKGWIRLEEGRLYLTGKGFLFADLIAGEFILD